MNHAAVKKLIANPNDKSFWSHTYIIHNEFGPIAIAYANCEQDALDEAVDSGRLGCQRMSDADHAEYDAKGWDDSFALLGNAGEPFWTEHLGIKQIR